MKSFDEKWSECAAEAREASTREERAPLGFAARVAARAFRAESTPTETLWLRLAMCSMVGVVAVLVVYAALELPHFRDRHPLDPGIENTVAELVWTL